MVGRPRGRICFYIMYPTEFMLLSEWSVSGEGMGMRNDVVVEQVVLGSRLSLVVRY